MTSTMSKSQEVYPLEGEPIRQITLNQTVFLNKNLAAEPHQHERMINSAPPTEIIHLFRSAALDSVVEIEGIPTSNRKL
jgi:hypothetical protein